jgi:hypothetical protein
MRAWVYKVNSRRPGKFTGPGRRSSQSAGGWHFDQYFGYRGRKPQDMGGREWIRSPQSWARLRRVRRGDLFVCFQSDERRIYGLARAASDGYESLAGSGRFDSVDFVAPRAGGALRLENTVRVTDAAVRETFQHIRAFTVPSRGTVHSLAGDELRALVRALVESNPAQIHPIRRMIEGRPRRRSQ